MFLTKLFSLLNVAMQYLRQNMDCLQHNADTLHVSIMRFREYMERFHGEPDASGASMEWFRHKPECFSGSIGVFRLTIKCFHGSMECLHLVPEHFRHNAETLHLEPESPKNTFSAHQHNLSRYFGITTSSHHHITLQSF